MPFIKRFFLFKSKEHYPCLMMQLFHVLRLLIEAAKEAGLVF